MNMKNNVIITGDAVSEETTNFESIKTFKPNSDFNIEQCPELILTESEVAKIKNDATLLISSSPRHGMSTITILNELYNKNRFVSGEIKNAETIETLNSLNNEGKK